jgi:hypothetical protein
VPAPEGREARSSGRAGADGHGGTSRRRRGGEGGALGGGPSPDRRYREELDANPGAWEPILDAKRRGAVTLLYSAHDTLHNGAVVLRDYLLARRTGRGRRGVA